MPATITIGGGATGAAGSKGDTGFGGQTYVVASSTATAAVKARADFTCDGVGDEVEINAALLLGNVRLTDGDYITAAPIAMTNPGVSLTGTGLGHSSSQSIGRGNNAGTRIIPSSGFTGVAIVNIQQAANAGPAGRAVLQDLLIDGVNIPIAQNTDGVLCRSYQFYLHNIFVNRPARHCFVIQGFDVSNGDPVDWHTYDGVMNTIRGFNGGRYDLKGGGGQNTDGCGLLFLNSAQDTYLSDSTFANNIASGVRRESGASNQCANVQIYSNLLHGIHYLGGGSRDKWVGMKIEHNNQHGCYFDGTSAGTAGVEFIGGHFSSNGEGANNTYDHISCSGSSQTTKVKLTGVSFYQTDSPTNLARYCVNLSAYGVGWSIVGCNLGTSLSTAGVVSGRINFSGTNPLTDLRVAACQGVRDYCGVGEQNGASPTTITAGAAAGTTPTVTLASGSRDACGVANVTTGTAPTTGALFNIVYKLAFNDTPGGQPFVTPRNAASAALGLYVSSNPTTGFTVSCATAPAASTALQFSYGMVI